MSQYRIMIVEDEYIVALDIESRLKDLGYQVVAIAHSGEDTLEQVRTIPTLPDLVLMDIKLKGKLDGIETAAQLRARYNIPVVYLTAFADPATLARARDTAPAGYILKPFDDLQLQTTLEMALYRLAIEAKLKESEIHFRNIYGQSPVGIALLDEDGRVRDANPACLSLFGLETAEQFAGYPFFEYPSLSPQMAENLKSILAQPGETFHMELCYNFKLVADMGLFTTRRSGEAHLSILITPWIVAEVQNRGYLLHIQDITDRKRAEERIQHNALYDALTDLPNRTFFLSHLAHIIDHCSRNTEYLGAVLFLDLDRFKFVNDSLGHAAGDLLLNVIAKRLKNCVRGGDFISRFGGDEFVILLEDISSIQEAVNIAERIQREVSLPIKLEQSEIYSSASIGIALTSHTCSSAEQLIRDADTAMYRAKANGKAQYAIFDAEMHASTMAFLEVESALRAALEKKQFVLHYQPIVAMESGTINGLSAVLRWEHPQRGMLYPAEFLHVAEETGLIVPIGEWVIRTACEQLSSWHASGHTALRVSINISSKQLRSSNLARFIQTTLDEIGLDPGALALEIKENSIVRDTEILYETILKIKNLGVSITIDNFGHSYSSLDRLKEFPANILKIDRSFLNNLPDNIKDVALISAIIRMAHVLNLKVVAEGIETQAQLDALLPECDEVQGWLFSPPVPASSLTELINRGKLDLSKLAADIEIEP